MIRVFTVSKELDVNPDALSTDDFLQLYEKISIQFCLQVRMRIVRSLMCLTCGVCRSLSPAPLKQGAPALRRAHVHALLSLGRALPRPGHAQPGPAPQHCARAHRMRSEVMAFERHDNRLMWAAVSHISGGLVGAQKVGLDA
jgi:hypothetical protein